MKTLLNNSTTLNYLTDGGLETELIFNKGIDLPHFAAFPLLDDPVHINTLNDYYREYLDLAQINQFGYVLESPTWRASADWAYKLGYSEKDLIAVNRKSIHQMTRLRHDYRNSIPEIVISGQIGPRGDGYAIESSMSPEVAMDYHQLQITAFKDSGADMASAITMTYVDEVLGIAKAARQAGLPLVISFTVETDGNLPSGESLEQAVSEVDRVTNGYPLYYMINCAHPTHFLDAIKTDSSWKSRIQGIRSNASCKSHAELDESTELDPGDKNELGRLHQDLVKYLPNLKVFGGCCGTDVSHVKSICQHIA